MKEIRVMLVDDHAIVRNSLRSILKNAEDIEVVGEAKEGIEALEKIQKLRPNVVVMDITMPGMNGFETTRQIKKKNPDIAVLILSMHSNQEYIFQTLRDGASGYLIKKSAAEDLIKAVYAARRGEIFLSSTIFGIAMDYIRHRTKTDAEDDPFKKLTDHEREVLQLITQGDSTRKIAEKLNISHKAVEAHSACFMGKLGIYIKEQPRPTISSTLKRY